MNYFDHASSTLPYATVLKEQQSFSMNIHANVNAKHKLGRILNEQKLSTQSFILKNFFNDSGELLFPHSATLANNLAISGIAFNEGDEICLFSGDHPSLYKPIKAQQNKLKIVIQEIELDDFSNEGEGVLEKISSKTKLVLLTSVNNQSGISFNASKVAIKIREKNPLVKIHLDASQSFSKLKEDYSMFDSVTFSSHKLGGMKGIAGLYLKNKDLYSPIFWGGSQQYGLYSGTEDIAALKLLETAIKENLKHQNESMEKIISFNNEIHRFLESMNFGFHFPFKNKTCSPFIMTFICPYLSSDILIRLLEEKEIYLSSSAACSSKIQGTNDTFLKLNIPKDLHKNVIRLSLSYETTQADLLAFQTALKEICRENSFLIKNKR